MFRNLKIRTKIFWAIFLPVLLALSTVVYLIHFHFEKRIVAEYEQIAIEDSHEKAHMLANTLSHFERMADQIAASIPNMNNWPEYLSNKRKIFPEIKAIFVSDAKGHLVFKTPQTNAASTLPAAFFRNLFSKAGNRGALLFSNQKQRVFVLSALTKAKGNTSPVGVFLELDMPFIFDSVLNFPSERNRIQFYFVDRNDQIVFSGNPNEVNRKLAELPAFKQVNHKKLTALLAPGGVRPFEILDKKDKTFLYLEPLESGQFGLAEQENLTPVLKAFQPSPRFLGIVVIFILLIILVVSEILAAHFSHPLQSLVDTLSLYRDKGYIPPMAKIKNRRDEYGILANEAWSYMHEIENKNQELRRAFQQLKISEERYFSFLNHSPNMIFVVEENRVIFANKKAKELLGEQTAQADGLKTLMFKNLQGQRTPLWELPDFHENFPVEGTLIVKNQEIPVLLYHARFDFNTTRNELFILVDVRRIKQLEILEKQMEWKLIESNRLASLGILTAGIAHNLYNPLTSIIGLGEILKMKYPEEKQINAILQAANQMEKTILLVTDRNKNEISNREMEIHLNDLLTDSLNLLEMNHRLNFPFEKMIRLDPRVPPIWGRYSDFSMGLEAFLSNAVEAMRESEHKVLTVETRFQANQIEIKIADTGVGIAREDLDKVFLPFFTTKTSPANKSGHNMGLGLFVARHLLEIYGATIDVSSRVGVGTTFLIQIPVAVKKQETQSSRSATDRQP